MNDSSPLCPRCGAPLASDAPQGLCPRCLVALPLSPETEPPEEAAPPRPPLAPAEIAPHFPQLEILELLGRGGMGVVYKARQKALDRCVALKLLAPERVGDPDFAQRFAREAQALARLSHPGIVAVHDFGEAGGFYYLLMEFVDGVNLRHALAGGRFTPEQALAMVPPICEALQFAHERGIVHRDIKPENLLLDRAGRVKIADFGIAKILGPEAHAAEERAAGTPGYMAPEQRATPGRADSRADIFSLGVVFYEMLTGELPARKIEPPSRKVRVDVRIDEIVLRALEREPERRYQTAVELGREVETAAAAPETPPVPPPIPAASAPVNPWPRRLFFLLLILVCGPLLVILLGLAIPLWMASRERAAVPHNISPPPAYTAEAARQIEFKLRSVDNSPETRRIMVNFDRDSRPDLGLELTQDVTPGPNGALPQPGYRNRRASSWAGPRDPRALSWTLPVEFTPQQVEAAGLACMQRARDFHSLPEGATIEFASLRHPAGWTYHLLALVHAPPALGRSQPPAPAGAAFAHERQIVVPQESRVTLELFRTVNDNARAPLGGKFTFKTAIGSGLGVILRWRAYGPDHPTHAHRWMLDLIDAQTGVIFHRIEDDFGEAVNMRPLDGSPPGEGTYATLERAGSSVFLRLLQADQLTPPAEPVRAWWIVQAFVTLGAENQEGDPPLFQLSPAPAKAPESPVPRDDRHAH